MPKFETWLDMTLALVDGGAAAVKITLEGPDGSTWGTWNREHTNLVASIAGMMAALREELPKGKHSAKLLAWASDGTQLSLFPVTLVGASDAATEGAQNQLVAQRANALFLSNVEKMQAGMMSMLTHTSDVAQQIAEANRNLSMDIEKSRIERDEGRIKALREEGKQRRLDQLTEKLMPMFELAVGVLAERAATWLETAEKSNGEKQIQGASSGGANTSGQTSSGQSDSARDLRCDPQSEEPRSNAPGCAGGDGGGAVGRSSGRNAAPTKQRKGVRGSC
jgi:hypothetical protein